MKKSTDRHKDYNQEGTKSKRALITHTVSVSHLMLHVVLIEVS